MTSRSKTTQAQTGGDAQAFGTAVGDLVKSFSGLNVPMQQLAALQGDYLKSASEIWNQSLQRLSAEDDKPPIGDRRFADSAWARNPAAAFTAQMYLLNARTLMQMAESVQGDDKTRARLRFAVQQWIDAASPSNYLASNRSEEHTSELQSH